MLAEAACEIEIEADLRCPPSCPDKLIAMASSSSRGDVDMSGLPFCTNRLARADLGDVEMRSVRGEVLRGEPLLAESRRGEPDALTVPDEELLR